MKIQMLATASVAMILATNAWSAPPPGRQIGAVWGKQEITREVLLQDSAIQTNPRILQVAEATAWLTHPTHTGGRYIGSAFLLGEFEGKYVMATNSHLIHEKLCSKVHIEFFFMEGRPVVKCTEVIIRDEDLDFALIAIDPGTAAAQLKDKGINFDYSPVPSKGTKLFTVGFSHLKGAPNQPNLAFLTRDDDCRVVSTSTKLIRNPKKDTEVFKPRHVQSFPNGCDTMVAGDCGAVYVNEANGRVIGMYWGEGKSDASAPDFVSRLLGTDETQYTGLWKDLTYGVPAHLIRESMLNSHLAKEPDYEKLFSAIFNR